MSKSGLSLQVIKPKFMRQYYFNAHSTGSNCMLLKIHSASIRSDRAAPIETDIKDETV